MALPEEATICVVGWPDLVAQALVRRRRHRPRRRRPGREPRAGPPPAPRRRRGRRGRSRRAGGRGGHRRPSCCSRPRPSAPTASWPPRPPTPRRRSATAPRCLSGWSAASAGACCPSGCGTRSSPVWPRPASRGRSTTTSPALARLGAVRAGRPRARGRRPPPPRLPGGPRARCAPAAPERSCPGTSSSPTAVPDRQVWPSGSRNASTRRASSVWWDPKIAPGVTYDRVIERALNQADCVVVLWSTHAVESDWVRAESDEGRRRGILVPSADRGRAAATPVPAHRDHRPDELGGRSAADAFDRLQEAVAHRATARADGPVAGGARRGPPWTAAAPTRGPGWVSGPASPPPARRSSPAVTAPSVATRSRPWRSSPRSRPTRGAVWSCAANARAVLSGGTDSTARLGPGLARRAASARRPPGLGAQDRALRDGTHRRSPVGGTAPSACGT